MKRDDDLIRQIMIDIEAEEDWRFLVPGETDDSSAEDSRVRYHMLLLSDAGLLVPVGKATMRMTAAGHDYLDAIRSETIWTKTKDGAKAVGGVTLGMLKDIAVAYLKKEATERLGITLG